MGYTPAAALANNASTTRTIQVGGVSPAGPQSASSALRGMALTGLTGLGGAASNFASYMAESSMLRDYGDILRAEAILEAQRVAEQGRQFKADQKMDFIMSGVQLGGTPIQVLEDTSLKIKDEVAAIERRGEAQRWLAYAEAAQTRNKGFTGFMSDLTDTFDSVNSLYSSAQKAGIFSYSGTKVKISSKPSKSSSIGRVPKAKSTGILLNRNAYQIGKGIV